MQYCQVYNLNLGVIARCYASTVLVDTFRYLKSTIVTILFLFYVVEVPEGTRVILVVHVQWTPVSTVESFERAVTCFYSFF